MSKPLNIAVLIFNHVEVLDFCGPFEVFSVTGRPDGTNPMNVYTVAEFKNIIARNRLEVIPSYTFDDCPNPDILVVPGGGGYDAEGNAYGSRFEMHNEKLLNWLKDITASCQNVLSVCTGAMILASAQLTKNLNATTHHQAFDSLRELDKTLTVYENKRVVDNGKYVFSGGISAGIDASFHLISKLFGLAVALETARYMEYDWSPDK